jgi:hypothetical protein
MRPQIHSFRDHHQEKQADADGCENDVERQRQPHLRPGKEKIAHGKVPSPIPAATFSKYEAVVHPKAYRPLVFRRRVSSS